MSNTAIEKVNTEIEPTNFHAVAINATEMQQSQEQIKSFLEQKVASIASEVKEVADALAVAEKNKWATKTYKNQVRRIESRKLYYSKLLSAIEAGYTIVPNMQVDIFAIRTNRLSWPAWNGNSGESLSSFNAASPRIPEEKEVILPVGKGNYRSNLQMFHEDRTKSKENNKDIYQVEQHCDGYADIEFPFAAAHPVVMDATSAAMAKKIFDRIGIVPQTNNRLRGDPIIIGQIVRKEGYSEKVTSFLIAWHLDVRTL